MIPTEIVLYLSLYPSLSMHWECFGTVLHHHIHNYILQCFTATLYLHPHTLHYGYGIVFHRMSDAIVLTCYEPRVMEQAIFLHLKVSSEYYVCMQLDVYIRHALRSTCFLYNLQSNTLRPEGFLTYHLTCLF